MTRKTLPQIVAEKPFHDYAPWWAMGPLFLDFMSEAIVSQWAQLPSNKGDLTEISQYTVDYLKIVYGQEARPSLLERFVDKDFTAQATLQSGEFDALSYAFYRSAFQWIEKQPEQYDHPLEQERRLFTQRVGKLFFSQLQRQLGLDLPDDLNDDRDFVRLKTAIRDVGAFLKTQGYLRDHFDFRFAVHLEHGGKRLAQAEGEFIGNLKDQELAYALYEMGYPVILPSAVYLYQTIGEAQHHSSRTIEELFALIGYEARETDDFDPTGYPSDRVVELWEIRPRL